MNLNSAISLTAWLWDQHPAIIYALERQVPGALGCISCDLDFLTCIGPGGCAVDSIDPSALGQCSSLAPLSCSGPDCTSGIPTLSESDLAPVPTCAVTISGGCNTNLVCSSAAATCAPSSTGLSGVANFLTSATGLAALAKVAAAYFQAQAAASSASAAQAKTAAAILAAQTARASAGQTALPVTYVANGATGTTTPMISTASGLVPLTNSILASLTPSSIAVFFAQYGTWILIGGAAAFLAYAASRRSST